MTWQHSHYGFIGNGNFWVTDNRGQVHLLKHESGKWSMPSGSPFFGIVRAYMRAEESSLQPTPYSLNEWESKAAWDAIAAH